MASFITSTRSSSPSKPSVNLPFHSTTGTNSNRISNEDRYHLRGQNDDETPVKESLPLAKRTDSSIARDGETWMDFLRHSSTSSYDNREQTQMADRRAALVTADKKRRFVGQQEELIRRRSSSLSFGHTPNECARQNTAQITSSSSRSVASRSSDSLAERGFPDRPLPPPPHHVSAMRRHTQNVTIPRWQSDSEVSTCPICGTRFSFWYRKHHCRKCGRVVCASCSPHRITIPRQFIVHPPLEEYEDTSPEVLTGSAIIDLTNGTEDDTSLTQDTVFSGERQREDNRVDTILRGRQEVRLCNPCVPDPNPLPHIPFTPGDQSAFDSFPPPETVARVIRPSGGQSDLNSGSQLRPYLSDREDSNGNHRPRQLQGFEPGLSTQPTASYSLDALAVNQHQKHATRPVRHTQRFPSNQCSTYGSAPNPSMYGRYVGPPFDEHHTPRHRHRHHASTSNAVPPNQRPGVKAVGSTRSQALTKSILREEDECPICHNALPPKGPGGSEANREAHVTFCIELHFAGPSSQASRPSPAPNLGTSTTATITNPSRPTESSSTMLPNTLEDRPERSASSVLPRRRTTGMVVYRASEKDCVGEDGIAAQECVICFEEFEVGVEMGRLECLCIFHKGCIRQWWDTKGIGACPVHQGGL